MTSSNLSFFHLGIFVYLICGHVRRFLDYSHSFTSLPPQFDLAFFLPGYWISSFFPRFSSLPQFLVVYTHIYTHTHVSWHLPGIPDSD